MTGLLVTFLILHQAFSLLSGALFELTDRALPREDLEPVAEIVRNQVASFKPAPPKSPETIKLLDSVSGIRRGANLFVDVSLAALETESKSLSVRDTVEFEDNLKRQLKSKGIPVKDVRIRWTTYSP